MNNTFRQLFVSAALCLVAAVSDAMDSPRLDVKLDEQWRFIRQDVAGAAEIGFDDSAWQTVSLPHTWNNMDAQDGGNDYYRGVGWYRRHLVVDPQYAGKSSFLKFDGAATMAEVFVNGKLVGSHEGNFAAFCFDVTQSLHVGKDNVIAVKVNNAKSDDVVPLGGDFPIFGGLYRDVHLLVLNRLSVTPLDYASAGVYIKQVRVTPDAAEFEITTKLRNANDSAKTATVRCKFSDAKENKVRELSSRCKLGANSATDVVQRLTISNPHLWNGRIDPYLYAASVNVSDRDKVTDIVTQPVGVRDFRVDPNEGFFLNGKRYELQGVSRHQDRLDKGWAIGPAEQREDFRLITEMGSTCVRTAHYQQDQYVYDLCDRSGLIVWTELSLVNKLTDSEAFADNARQQLTELIKQNYNHSSIVFWGIFNELHAKSSWNDAPAKWDLVIKLNSLAKELDPTRVTTAASCIKAVDPLNSVTDVIAFNRYYGWYHDKATDWPSALDKLHKDCSNRCVGISEYGAGASVHQHEIPPRQPKPDSRWHPEEWQCVVHEQAWLAMKDRQWLWCKLLWNMFDFAIDSRDEGDQPGRNDKGLVTYDRKVKKDAFYWYKANWTEAPFVYITSRRFTKRTEAETPVKIYSNCDAVELKLNGKSQGTVRSNDHIFLWDNVALAPGENRVEGIGTKSRKTFTDTCTWEYEARKK
jgi:beta-galactosidase